MTARIDAIADHLEAAGLVNGATGWTVQKLAARDLPDQVVVIAPTGGPQPEQDTARHWLRPSYQLLVRGQKQAGPHAAWDKAQAVLASLDRAAITGFTNFRATASEPVLLPADPDGRPVAVVNFSGDAA